MTNVYVVNMSVRISHTIMNLHFVLVLTTQRERKVHRCFSLQPSNLTTRSEVLSHPSHSLSSSVFIHACVYFLTERCALKIFLFFFEV